MRSVRPVSAVVPLSSRNVVAPPPPPPPPPDEAEIDWTRKKRRQRELAEREYQRNKLKQKQALKKAFAEHSPQPFSFPPPQPEFPANDLLMQALASQMPSQLPPNMDNELAIVKMLQEQHAREVSAILEKLFKLYEHVAQLKRQGKKISPEEAQTIMKLIQSLSGQSSQ